MTITALLTWYRKQGRDTPGEPGSATLNKRVRLLFLLEDSKSGLSKGRGTGDKAICGSFGGTAVITQSYYGIW